MMIQLSENDPKLRRAVSGMALGMVSASGVAMTAEDPAAAERCCAYLAEHLGLTYTGFNVASAVPKGYSADPSDVTFVSGLLGADPSAVNEVVKTLDSGKCVVAVIERFPEVWTSEGLIVSRFPIRFDRVVFRGVPEGGEVLDVSGVDATDVTPDTVAVSAVSAIIDMLMAEDLVCADFRIEASRRIMKCASSINGDDIADSSYVLLLRDMLWDTPRDIPAVESAVMKAMFPGSADLLNLISDVKVCLRDAVSKKKFVDESAGFPRNVYCADCNRTFVNMRQLCNHSVSCPDHRYIDPHKKKSYIDTENEKFTYDRLLAILMDQYSWDLLSPSDEADRAEFAGRVSVLRESCERIASVISGSSADYRERLRDNRFSPAEDSEEAVRVFEDAMSGVKEVQAMLADIEHLMM